MVLIPLFYLIKRNSCKKRLCPTTKKETFLLNNILNKKPHSKSAKAIQYQSFLNAVVNLEACFSQK